MKKLNPLLLILFALACHSGPKPSAPKDMITSKQDDSLRSAMEAQKKEIAADMARKEISHLIITAPENKYGYYILIDGQIYIEQKTIPAIEGHKGFSTKADAEKVALKVIEKIKQGELPPSISVEELKDMDVAF